MSPHLALEDWKSARMRATSSAVSGRPGCSLCRDFVAERYPEQAVARRLDAMHAHRLDRGKREGLAGAEVEARPVERALDDASLDVEVALVSDASAWLHVSSSA